MTSVTGLSTEKKMTEVVKQGKYFSDLMWDNICFSILKILSHFLTILLNRCKMAGQSKATDFFF
jgi:hypothetical protein